MTLEFLCVGIVCFFLGWCMRGQQSGEMSIIVKDALRKLGKREGIYFSINITRDSAEDGDDDEEPPEIPITPELEYDFRNN